jgi:hypothetical protein
VAFASYGTSVRKTTQLHVKHYSKNTVKTAQSYNKQTPSAYTSNNAKKRRESGVSSQAHTTNLAEVPHEANSKP